MRLTSIKPMIKTGFKEIWRNRLMSFASIGSVASSLIILGIILITVLNINNITNLAKEEFNEIHIYLKDELSQEEIDNIGKEIENIKGVSDVLYQSKDIALQSMIEQWGEEGSLLQGLEVNPLPNTFVVRFEDIKYSETVVLKLEGLAGIEDIKINMDVVNKLLSINDFVRIAGLIITSILIFISIFIISNTIKITVAARRREIKIMKYVGATNSFIRGPFILEGMILGLVGSLLAIGIVNFSYKYIFDLLAEKFYVILTVYMIPPSVLYNEIYMIFGSIGIGIGILGSVISLKKYIEV